MTLELTEKEAKRIEELLTKSIKGSREALRTMEAAVAGPETRAIYEASRNVIEEKKAILRKLRLALRR